MPEAVAMKQYAMEMGVSEEAMTVEKESVNTKENLLFSKKIIDAVSEKDYPNILIISNRYHVFRALLTAKDLGIQSDGRGSKTKLYFALNAYIREFIAYLYYWRKRYVIGLAVGSGLILLTHIMSVFII